jgi:energy-coupling factor transporter ATP-binding protein EcfA2
VAPVSYADEATALEAAAQLRAEARRHRGLSNEAAKERVVSGGDFILDEPDKIPAVWGEGERVMWAEGEGVMLVGHQGVGKTTIGQQLVLSRLGIRDSSFLGLPVAATDRPILYLAMDRPRQAARSFRRMVIEANRTDLNDKLTVWKGPLPFDPTASTKALADFVMDRCPNVGTVVIDSVKDLVPGLSDDKIGSALNSSWQEVIARGVELILLHHQRKAGSDAKRMNKLDDVFGSTWLTSGLGSVIAIIGEPGDPVVELAHLKQPGEPVGPLAVRHDHVNGRSVLSDTRELIDVLRDAGDAGLSAQDAAQQFLGRSAAADIKKIQRELAKLQAKELVTKIPGGNSSGGRLPDVYRLSPEQKWADQVQTGASQ